MTPDPVNPPESDSRSVPASAKPLKSLRVVLPPQHGPLVRKILQILTRLVTERCDAKVTTTGQASLTVELAIQPGIGKEGFTIADGPAGSIRIAGGDERGLLYGVGRFLRASRYDQGGFTAGTWRGTSAPASPVRGIYFATHFFNFYHAAPLEEVDRVIEDFALWGGNHLLVCYDMHDFKGFQDPVAQAMVARLKHINETADGVGVKFGLGFVANDGYTTSPKELRADYNTGRMNFGLELCPSKPEGFKLLARQQAEVLDAFPSVAFIVIAPYDNGGCACSDCKPWGCNGFLRASEQLAKLYHQRCPDGEVRLFTWLFDFTQDDGEFRGFFQYIREKQPTWFNEIMTGTHGNWIAKQLLDRPFPEQYPLTCFPEISMYQATPYGGYGANPLPDACTQLATNLRGHVVGGFPYSEGIFEDVNKFFWAQFYWRADRPTDEVLAEYAAYYFGPDSAADAVRLFHLLEKTLPRENWKVTSLNEAEEVWVLTRRIDGRLAPWAKTSWRWRILYIRAAIDHVLKTQGTLNPEGQAALKPFVEELTSLYHVTPTTHEVVRPAPFPKPPALTPAGK